MFIEDFPAAQLASLQRPGTGAAAARGTRGTRRPHPELDRAVVRGRDQAAPDEMETWG